MGINTGELVIIALIAVFLLGPDRLPEYAQGLARFIRRARDFARGAREQVRTEMGPEFDDIDWKRYDPRRYHPRTIVRNALSEAWEEDEDDAPTPRTTGTPSSRAPRGLPAVNGSGREDRAAGAASRLSSPSGGRSSGARAARSPRPPAVKDVQRPSPPPTSWGSVTRSDGGGVPRDPGAT